MQIRRQPPPPRIQVTETGCVVFVAISYAISDTIVFAIVIQHAICGVVRILKPGQTNVHGRGCVTPVRNAVSSDCFCT